MITPIAIGIASLCWGCFPALLDRGHFVEDLMHGVTIPTTVGLTAFMLIMCLGLRKISLCKTNGRSPWPHFWAMLGSWFLMGMLAIIFFEGRDYKLVGDLRDHGVPVQARLVRQFTEGCSKHGCSTGLEYSFVPKGQTEPVDGFVSEGNTSRRSNAEYESAISTNVIPIVYDPADPSHSLVNWNNWISNHKAPNSELKMTELFAAFLLFAVALMGLLLSPIARSVSASKVDLL